MTMNNDMSELNLNDLEQVNGGVASAVAVKDPEPLPRPVLLPEPVRPGDYL
jgi:hypothetical protein